GSECGD
ncbi:methyl-accepting chemotaxis (MCP) signaling domain protein, partial [Vibrio parahaemolyticus V-223/04]